MHEIELIERGGRHRNSAMVQLAATLLQGTHDDEAAGQIHLFGRDFQRLALADAGIMHELAEGAHLARRCPRGPEEGGPLLGSEIEAAAGLVIELHSETVHYTTV